MRLSLIRKDEQEAKKIIFFNSQSEAHDDNQSSINLDKNTISSSDDED